jgi:hypothetical protein
METTTEKTTTPQFKKGDKIKASCRGEIKTYRVVKAEKNGVYAIDKDGFQRYISMTEAIFAERTSKKAERKATSEQASIIKEHNKDQRAQAKRNKKALSRAGKEATR